MRKNERIDKITDEFVDEAIYQAAINREENDYIQTYFNPYTQQFLSFTEEEVVPEGLLLMPTEQELVPKPDPDDVDRTELHKALKKWFEDLSE